MLEQDASGGGTVEKATAWIVDMAEKVINEGVGPITGSVTWAEDRLSRRQGTDYRPPHAEGRLSPESMKDDVDAVVARLVRESVTAAGTQGFLTGLGGLVVAGMMIPANIAATFAINIRMVGAIAHLRGWDVKDPHVRTVALMLAIGMSAQSVLAAFGVKLGQRLAQQAIKKIPAELLRALNKKAGTHLVVKYGTKRGMIVLVKGVPLVGGLVGGAVDATSTGLIGKAADRALRGDDLRAAADEAAPANESDPASSR